MMCKIKPYIGFAVWAVVLWGIAMLGALGFWKIMIDPSVLIGK
jgi:hypothetical protein